MLVHEVVVLPMVLDIVFGRLRFLRHTAYKLSIALANSRCFGQAFGSAG
jgi:hypothetical protein